MVGVLVALLLAVSGTAAAEDGLSGCVRSYLADLIRLDSSNPPGNETRVAEDLHGVAAAEGIAGELLGDRPDRLSFVARLPGSGKRRPRGAICPCWPVLSAGGQEERHRHE